MTEQLCCAYITVSTMEMAQNLGRQLIEERLAACINIYPQVEAIFRWEGEIKTVSEVVLLAKTVQSKIELINVKVKEITDYDMACLITYPYNGGCPEFIQWLHDEVKS